MDETDSGLLVLVVVVEAAMVGGSWKDGLFRMH